MLVVQPWLLLMLFINTHLHIYTSVGTSTSTVSDATRILREIKLLRLLRHPGMFFFSPPRQHTSTSFELH